MGESAATMNDEIDHKSRKRALVRAFDGKSLAESRQGVSLDDLFLGSIGSTMRDMQRFQEAFGIEVGYRVKLDDGTEITFKRPENMPDWRSRLGQIIRQSVSTVGDMGLDVEPEDLALKIMKAEGWVLNPKTLKTPPWMDPFREVPVKLLDSIMRRNGIRKA